MYYCICTIKKEDDYGYKHFTHFYPYREDAERDAEAWQREGERFKRKDQRARVGKALVNTLGQLDIHEGTAEDRAEVSYMPSTESSMWGLQEKLEEATKDDQEDA